MKKIILASASAQRKNLMRLLKLPFVIRKSRAEEVMRIETTVQHLVRKNALIKALDVAEEVEGEALVIGADTVVYAKGQLVLKPKHLKEAKENLKMLMSAPHWVYTGVAVIDARSKVTLVEHERTKVFMTPLDDAEIDRYHREVPPMDKAGGFDIEGRGGLFIPRIEGCYFNVVGLPLARLAAMLKKFGVHALTLLCMFTASGCSGLSTNFNTATRSQETTMYSTDREQEIGAAVAANLEKDFEVLDNVELNTRVDQIMQRIAAACDRKDIIFIAKVVQERKPEKESMVNAVSLPGGYVYLFRGLTDLIKNDDELAAVIAHEIGHIAARHSIKRLQASYGNLVAVLAAVATNGQLAGGLSAATTVMMFKYSQDDEIEADRLGVRYMQAAGYNSQGMLDMLDKLGQYDRKQPARPLNLFRTHPYVHQRLASVNREIKGDLSFQDYVRLTGEREDYKK